MDELPREARDFLDQTRDAHDPPDRNAARERVRARLMAAITVPAALHGGASTARAGAAGTHALKSWFAVTSKPFLATALLALGAAGIWMTTTPRRTEPQPRRASTAAPAPVAPVVRVQPLVPAVRPLAAPSAAGQLSHEGITPRARAIATADGSLTQETQLLSRASGQIAHNDIAAALQSLEQHRRRFGANSLLAQEREGLTALVGCLSHAPASPVRAKRYIARVPHSVLVPRLEHACNL